MYYKHDMYNAEGDMIKSNSELTPTEKKEAAEEERSRLLLEKNFGTFFQGGFIEKIKEKRNA